MADKNNNTDPANIQLSWEAASSGGSSFKIKSMHMKDKRVIFKRSIRFVLFHLPVIIPGLLAFILGVPFFISEGVLGMVVFMLVFGSILTGLGFYSLLKEKTFIIDLESGEYYFVKAQAKGQEKSQEKGPVNGIQAMQLLSKSICNTSSPYTSYELNLVLKNGERITVLDHGDYQHVKNCGERLSAILNVLLLREER